MFLFRLIQVSLSEACSARLAVGLPLYLELKVGDLILGLCVP